MNRKLFTFLMCIFASAAFAQSDNRLMFLNQAIQPEANLQKFISGNDVTSSEIFEGYYYRFIQFNNIPSQELKNAMVQSGLRLMDYMPYKAFMVAIPANYNKSQLAAFDIRSIVKQTPEQKYSKHMFGDAPEYAVKEKGYVDIRVQFHENISMAKAMANALTFGKILNATDLIHVIELRVKQNDIAQLAQQPWTYFIDVIAPPSEKEDNKGRSLHRVNVINADYALGRHYDGSGVAAALADDGIVGPHIDFTGRLTNHLAVPGGFHGDMTSGILAGAGNLDPTIRGMATGVQLHVFDINGYPQIIDAVTNNATLGTVISSTSYSQGCNEYTTDTQFGDQTIHDNSQLEFVFSAGNNNGADCGYGAGGNWGNITGGYKQGKNVIACANLDALEVIDPSSSIGPASDGRIKPDISSNGRDQMSTDEGNTYQVGGGTSAACPGIAGICTELIQAYKQLNSVPDAPTALIKACLLNSAEDIGNAGPDFKFGWGRVNALRAVQTLEDNRYLSSALAQGGTDVHSITVPAGVSQLRVMIYWHDQAGTPGASVTLVNDLDMTVTDPSSTAWEPWVLDPTPDPVYLNTPAIRAADHLNNVEQVTIDNPSAGTYTINVNGFAVPQGPQEYYMVYEFRMDDITVTYPMGGEGFVPGEQEVIRWDALKGIGAYTLEYSVDNGTSWNNIANNVGQDLQQYTWTIPNAPTGDALVRVNRGAVTGQSNTRFTIIGVPQNIAVVWECPDSLRLVWDAVPNASTYEISQLGTMYMDSIGTSATNSFVVNGTSPLVEYWFSVRAIMANGNKGRRAIAIYQNDTMYACPLSVDVGTSLILSPSSGTLQDCQNVSAATVSIQIENPGINTVSNIPVHYRVNGGAVVNDVYTGSLVQYATANFSFPSTINLSIAGTYLIQVWADYPGDLNAYNDTLVSTVTVIPGTLAAIPFMDDFQSYALCGTNNDCEATICNFGGGWLNETNLDQDDIDFRVNAGPTPSVNTGPDVDHTTGTATGNYIYLEASVCFSKRSNLISPCIDLTTSTAPTMTFWYHMYGVNMGTLHTDVYSNGTWVNDVILAISGDHGNAWQMVSVNLSAYVGQIINVRFRAETGIDYTSDIALDDINIYETSAPPTAQFVSNTNSGCIGKVINFTDMSTNSPTSWTWSFNPNTVTYVNGTSATSQNPHVQFSSAGPYDVTLTATNGFGSGSSTQTSYITILAPQLPPVVEDFQGASFPPVNWKIESAGGAYTWAQSVSVTGSDGLPTFAAFVDNFDYNNPGAQDGLATFEFDLASATSALMTFDVAYARYSATFSDTLRVDVSNDCGTTYTPSAYYLGGTNLATVPDQTALWSPLAAGEWRNDTVDLSSYIGQNILVKFVNINGYGNSLFVDNVNIDMSTGIQHFNSDANVSVIPNPSSGVFNLEIKNAKAGTLEYTITDMKGRSIVAKQIPVSGNYSEKIDLSKKSKGVYMLSLKSDNGIKQIKLIVL